MVDTGIVYLVGAGPGDPELLTLKALRLIETADVVVYDRLVSKEILALIPQNASRIDVGKRPGSHPVPQSSINQILLKLARPGQSVVRLKGGDPMIFGRGGEEAKMLHRHGVEVITVPGITAAQGCAASLNLPLTLRNVSDSLIYVTGHSKEDGVPNKDWAKFADGTTTLVVYMGAANIENITQKMIENGVSRSMPAMAICNGTLATQKQLSSTVSTLSADVTEAGFEGPVIFIIGNAAAITSYNEMSDDDQPYKKIAVAGM